MSELIKAIEKIRQQGENARHPMSKMLSMQIIDHISTTSRAKKVLEEGKNLDDCQRELDNFANRKKSENKSFINPDEAELVIFKYFGFDDAVEDKQNAPIIDINNFI